MLFTGWMWKKDGRSRKPRALEREWRERWLSPKRDRQKEKTAKSQKQEGLDDGSCQWELLVELNETKHVKHIAEWLVENKCSRSVSITEDLMQKV